MRRSPLAALAMLLLAGCSTDPETATPPAIDGPLDLTGRLGLMIVDLETRGVEAYTEQNALAWMSADGRLVTWTEADFNLLVDRSTGQRELGPRTVWARIYGNATALELVPGEARLRHMLTGEPVWNESLPPAPLEGAAWTAASDDLAVLGAEFPTERRAACSHDLFILAARVERTIGCHLRVAADGRVAWTEAAGVRVRESSGAITNVTGPGSGDPSKASFVAHENPLFTRDSLVMLRVTGGARISSTEIVAANGTALAKMTGPRQLALHDVSDDGRFVLLRAFER